MYSRTLLALTLLGMSSAAFAGSTTDWPTSYQVDDYEFGIKGTLQYDLNQFSDDRLANGSNAFEDANTWRRQTVELYALKKGVFDLHASYDFQGNSWQDTFVGLTTGVGRFRLGEFKTPVGWEDGSTSSSATTFLETSLPEQAVYEGRRLGAEWSYAGLSRWLFQVSAFGRHDLNEAASGNTMAARVAFNPLLQDREVIHLGLSASRELRDDRTARERARPEVSLTDIRLVDSGNLVGVDRIDRAGLEAAWLKDSWLVQSEYLVFNAHRNTGANYKTDGYYVSGSWLLTGESRGYRNSAFTNPKPTHAWGALELALRYSTLNLNDGDVRGGDQHDWTLGVNWYIDSRFKLQANYIRTFSDRRGLNLDPKILALRAQLAF